MTEATIDIYADTRGVAQCLGPHCHAVVTWAEVVRSGKRVCFSGQPAALATRQERGTYRLIESIAFADAHWPHCPDAPEFKQPR